MMRSERLSDWQERLSHLIANRLHTPFKWGLHDCALWAADCRYAVTGIDDGAEYRGTYSTGRGALRRLYAVDGVRSPVEAADRRWGHRRHPSQAIIGDPVAADLVALGVADPREPRGLGMSLGVCYGKHCLFVGSEGGRAGLISLPTLVMDHCYG